MFDKSFYKQADKLSEIFMDYMSDRGFSVSHHNDKYSGNGVTASHKEDKFVPIFKLVNQIYSKSFSIFVDDRNGNTVLTGETAAIYSVNAEEDMSESEIIEIFEKMLNDIYDKYGDYCKGNRLDFTFNELEMERKNYTKDLEIGM